MFVESSFSLLKAQSYWVSLLTINLTFMNMLAQFAKKLVVESTFLIVVYTYFLITFGQLFLNSSLSHLLNFALLSFLLLAIKTFIDLTNVLIELLKFFSILISMNITSLMSQCNHKFFLTSIFNL